jgi:Predicted NADH:ubiquinone oxidoreductase, subunit RnfE
MIEAKESFVPNPLLSGLLGICPVIAACRSLADGVALGLGVAVCAILLGAIVPPARAVIADRLQAPATLALSAAIALAYGSALRMYSPALAAELWIYLPLLSVSALSLHTIRRCSSIDRIGPDGRSRLAVVSIESLLFLLTASLFGCGREAIGLGTITLPSPGMSCLSFHIADSAPLRILVSPAGGFILMAFIVATYRAAIGASGRRLA